MLGCDDSGSGGCGDVGGRAESPGATEVRQVRTEGGSKAGPAVVWPVEQVFTADL